MWRERRLGPQELAEEGLEGRISVSAQRDAPCSSNGRERAGSAAKRSVGGQPWSTAAVLQVLRRARARSHELHRRMGVTKDLVKAGDGKTRPKTGDELTMHYTGWLARTETKFDSSVDKGKPFVFKVHAF